MSRYLYDLDLDRSDRDWADRELSFWDAANMGGDVGGDWRLVDRYTVAPTPLALSPEPCVGPDCHRFAAVHNPAPMCLAHRQQALRGIPLQQLRPRRVDAL